MQSRLALNLILLIVAAALAAVIFFAPGRKDEPVIPLAQVDENAVHSISLQNKEAIAFEKQGNRWWIKSPFSAPANERRIRQLFDIAKAKSEARYPVPQDDLAKFELDKPKATLVLGDVVLSFGGSDPINRHRYARVGDTLHLVADDFFQYLAAPATDYVDKKLLPENAKPVELLLPELHLKMSPDGKWASEPAGKSDEAVHDIVNAWQTARAIEVQRAGKATQGDVIKVSFANDSPIEFIIVQREPDLILARTDWGLQFHLAGETAKRLLGLPQKAPPDTSAPKEKVPPAAEPEPESEPEPP